MTYRKFMLQKNCVFEKMREKLGWFKKNAGTPEAGQAFYQHDGAHLHTAKFSEQHWSKHGAKKGFNIQVVTQPAQSPDLNWNDLALIKPFKHTSLRKKALTLGRRKEKFRPRNWGSNPRASRFAHECSNH